MTSALAAIGEHQLSFVAIGILVAPYLFCLLVTGAVLLALLPHR